MITISNVKFMKTTALLGKSLKVNLLIPIFRLIRKVLSFLISSKHGYTCKNEKCSKISLNRGKFKISKFLAHLFDSFIQYTRKANPNKLKGERLFFVQSEFDSMLKFKKKEAK